MSEGGGQMQTSDPKRMKDFISQPMRKKLILPVGSFLLIVLIVIVWWAVFGRMDGFSVQGIQLGDSSEKLLSVMGEPEEKTGFNYNYPDVEFTVRQSKVVAFKINTREYRIKGDIGVGSKLQDIVKVYGKAGLKQQAEDSEQVFMKIGGNGVISFRMDITDRQQMLYDTTPVREILVAERETATYLSEESFDELWQDLTALQYETDKRIK
jgi:hypothetical protein